MPHPKVTAIVLNWNNYSDTAECLSNLTEMSYPNFEILLLDNGSTDDSGERLAQEFRNMIEGSKGMRLIHLTRHWIS